MLIKTHSVCKFKNWSITMFAVVLGLACVTFAAGQGPWESDQRITKIPENVKEFLRSAEDLTIRMEAAERGGKMVGAMNESYEPNLTAVVTKQNLRDRFLDKFFEATDSEFMGAICYLPSHSIEARSGERFVNIEICFGCRKYIIEGSFGKYYGTIAYEEESEVMFNSLLLDNRPSSN